MGLVPPPCMQLGDAHQAQRPCRQAPRLRCTDIPPGDEAGLRLLGAAFCAACACSRSCSLVAARVPSRDARLSHSALLKGPGLHLAGGPQRAELRELTPPHQPPLGAAGLRGGQEAPYPQPGSCT